ncbi:MAG: SprT-like domain-containing protein [Candidatus Dojkabacteria bacterium]|nr:SprT-like domain-containing protein [Candidatus Dojkabacteria bacterium]
MSRILLQKKYSASCDEAKCLEFTKTVIEKIQFISHKNQLQRFYFYAIYNFSLNFSWISAILPWQRIFTCIAEDQDKHFDGGSTIAFVETKSSVERGNTYFYEPYFNIYFNKEFWRKYDEQEKQNLVSHELAHFIAIVLYGNTQHDYQWRKIAKILGDTHRKAFS